MTNANGINYTKDNTLEIVLRQCLYYLMNIYVFLPLITVQYTLPKEQIGFRSRTGEKKSMKQLLDRN